MFLMKKLKKFEIKFWNVPDIDLFFSIIYFAFHPFGE